MAIMELRRFSSGPAPGLLGRRGIPNEASIWLGRRSAAEDDEDAFPGELEAKSEMPASGSTACICNGVDCIVDVVAGDMGTSSNST